MAVVLGGKNGIYLASFAGPTPPPVLDPDAVAFLTAAGITDPTIESAINTLVVDMKTASIWTKMKAVYPFVGGTATTHKYNLKNPLDTNAAFRLTFNGGWTHSSTGAKPNGTNAFANSYLIPNVNLITDYASLHYYSRTSESELATGRGTAIGVRSTNVTVNNNLALIPRRFDNFSLFNATFTGVANELAYYNPETSGAGLFSGALTSLGSKIYKNGINLTTVNASANKNTPNLALYLGANNDKGASVIEYTLRESAFAGIADTLTDTETANLYTAVQAFNTTLGRQV